MVSKECSMGGFNLRKCPSTGNKRPRVKRTTKPKPRSEDAPKSTRSGRRYGGEGLVYGTEQVGGMAIPLSDKQKQGLEHYRETHPSKMPPPPSGSPMPTVPLGPMSPNQRSKLRNGHPVRVKMGTGSCDDCSCKMKEENIKKIMKKKGGAATVKLDEDEKRENKFSGTGIMKGARGGPKHGGVQAPAGKGIKIIQKTKSKGGVAGLISMTDVKEGRATLAEYKRSREAQKKAADELKRRKGEAEGDPEPGTKRGRSGGDDRPKRRRGGGITYGDGGGITYGDGGSIGYGGSIGRRSSTGIPNVGAGGNILAPMQASKAPQAASQNWFFHTQFPPAMAHQIVEGKGGYYGFK